MRIFLRLRNRFALFGLAMLVAMPVSASEREMRIPLREGRLHVSDLSDDLLRRLGLPVGFSFSGSPTIDLNSIAGSLFVTALDRSLGDGCEIAFTPTELHLRFDSEQLPRSLDETRRAARVFTAEVTPDATADQNRFYGLLLPPTVDASRPITVLVHGLDSDRTHWRAIADLLEAEGHQPAYFTYPSDQPLADSAAWLGQNLAALRETFPEAEINVLAHSAGCLVSRAWIEGPGYDEGVEHLILVAPPNHGSPWAPYRLLLEAEEHYNLWQHESKWRPTWSITDGLGEAGRDLRPGSSFLRALNVRPRRAEVEYTIIAGSHHPAHRWTADALERTAEVLPERSEKWWVVGPARRSMARTAAKLRGTRSSSDGPVPLASTRLRGVDDHVTLPADHTTLCRRIGGETPAAWPTIRNRLIR